MRFASVFLLLLAVPGCAGSGAKNTVVSEAEFPSSALRRSAAAIDSYPAREVFFVLPSAPRCLTASAQATVTGETIMKQPEPQKICFIVEKPISLPSAPAAWYELARNSSSDWELSGSVTACTSDTSPFQKLAAGVYRIRLTTFAEKEFSVRFTLDIPRARFFVSYEEAADYMRSLDEQRKK